MRFRRHDKHSLFVYVGPWACRVAWDHGRFSNGSRWFSGWYRWRDDPWEEGR